MTIAPFKFGLSGVARGVEKNLPLHDVGGDVDAASLLEILSNDGCITLTAC